MASLGLDLGDDDMLNDGNDGSAPLADCVDGTAPPLPLASAGTSGEGGAADATEAAAANGLDERLRTMVPMFHAAGRVSVDMLKSGLVHYGGVKFCDESLRKRPPNEGKLKAQYIRKATPGTTWSNGAYTRRSPQARSPAPRRALAANPNPTDDAISRRRVRHHRARSLPAAGGVHPVWARGGHVTGTWPRLYFVKNVLLICVFTEQTLFGGLKRTRGPVQLDRFRTKTILFHTYQDLAAYRVLNILSKTK